MNHFKLELIKPDGLIAGGQLTKCVDHQTPNRVEFLITETGAEECVEILDRGECLYQKRVVIDRANQLALFNIGLVFNFTDNFFQNIFDGDQARDASILVYDDRHVVAVLTKLPQQDIQSLAFGYGGHRPHQFRNAGHICVALYKWQQVFGQ